MLVESNLKSKPETQKSEKRKPKLKPENDESEQKSKSEAKTKSKISKPKPKLKLDINTGWTEIREQLKQLGPVLIPYSNIIQIIRKMNIRTVSDILTKFNETGDQDYKISRAIQTVSRTLLKEPQGINPYEICHGIRKLETSSIDVDKLIAKTNPIFTITDRGSRYSPIEHVFKYINKLEIRIILTDVLYSICCHHNRIYEQFWGTLDNHQKYRIYYTVIKNPVPIVAIGSYYQGKKKDVTEYHNAISKSKFRLDPGFNLGIQYIIHAFRSNQYKSRLLKIFDWQVFSLIRNYAYGVKPKPAPKPVPKTKPISRSNSESGYETD